MNQLAFISLGSNLGDSPQIILQAMDSLQMLSDSPLRRSSLWQTTPVDCPPGSPLFVNAMVGLRPRSEEAPETLLEKLQALERSFGRPAMRALNAPRLLDLDLIAFGRLVRAAPGLMLPHPRAARRRFVLEPLNEIAPDFVLPGQSRAVLELLAALAPDPRMRRLT